MKNLTLLLLLMSSPASAEALGRLFFTPAERQTLEQQRQNKTAAVIQPSGNLTLNGVIQKHGSGKTLIWTNDNAQNEITDPKIRAGIKSSIPVTVPATGQSVDVKVGQTLDMDSGNVAATSAAKRKIGQTTKPVTAPVLPDDR